MTFIVDLGEMGVLVILLVLMYGLQLLIRSLASVFSYVPFVGGSIADTFTNLANGAIERTLTWDRSKLGELGAVVWQTVTWDWAQLQRIGDGLWAAGEMGWRIITVTIPNAAGAVLGQANQLVNGAEISLNNRVTQVEGEAQALYHQAIATAHVDVLQAAGQAEANLQSAVGTLLGDIGSAEAAAIHAGQAAIAGVRTEVQGWIGGAVATVERDIGVAKDAAIGAAALTTAAALAKALAATGAVSVELEDYLSKCGRNLCSGLNPLSTLLQELTPLLEGGILFALVAEAARNPAGVADEVHAVLSPVATEAASLFRDATGVAA